MKRLLQKFLVSLKKEIQLEVEGAASGLPVLFYKDCGGINELCEKHGEMYENFEDFQIKLKAVSDNLNFYKSKIKTFDEVRSSL